MLSPIFMVDLAVPQRKRSRMGTCLMSDSATARSAFAVQKATCALLPAGLTAAQGVVRPRPQAYNSTALLGFSAQAAALADSAQQQPTSKVNYAHTTRIAASGGGSLGPHPARDPV